MIALKDDVPRQLLANGVQILSQGGNPEEGFHFECKLGPSIGALTNLSLVDYSSKPYSSRDIIAARHG